MKYHYTYRITNIRLNKHYYGVRTSLVEPKHDLGITYFSSSTDKDFKQDQKVNTQDYKYKVICIFDSRKLAYALEIKLHSRFNVGINESFYNKVRATSLSFDRSGLSHSDEIKYKISNALSGNKLSEITKQKISKSNTGRILSEETRKKQGDAKRGISKTEEHKLKLYEANKNFKHDDESKLKISKSKLGIKQDKIKCPHCEKEGGGSLMKRYHFKNCKLA